MHSRVRVSDSPDLCSKKESTVHEASTYSRYLDLSWCSTNSIHSRCSPFDFRNEDMHMVTISILPKETQHKVPHAPESNNFLWILLEYFHMHMCVDDLRALNIWMCVLETHTDTLARWKMLWMVLCSLLLSLIMPQKFFLVRSNNKW